MSGLWPRPSTPTGLGWMPWYLLPQSPSFSYHYKHDTLLHLDSDRLCCSSTYAQSLAFCEASNQKLLSMWVINDQKGHYGFILSLELFNRDESFKGWGCHWCWGRRLKMLSGRKLWTRFGTGKEVEIPCVLLPLKCELKTEGGMCLAET